LASETEHGGMRPLAHARFLIALLLATIAWWPSLRSVVRLALSNDNYSYVLLVLVISAGFLCLGDWTDLIERQASPVPIILLLTVLGLAAWGNYRRSPDSGDGPPTVSILCFVIFVLVVFLVIYRREAFARMRFPLLLLLLAVPLPSGVVSTLVAVLQRGSAEASYLLFRLFRIPVMRQGLVFSFSNIEIEVAQECSGIRSSTILVVTTLVLAQMFLRAGWRKAVAVLCSLPIAVAKNGVRIFTLSLLGEYVSTSWLEGSLHRQGGFVFFGLGLGMVIAVIRLLRREEGRGKSINEVFRNPSTELDARAKAGRQSGLSCK
jgi:exosortase